MHIASAVWKSSQGRAICKNDFGRPGLTVLQWQPRPVRARTRSEPNGSASPDLANERSSAK